MYCCCGVLLPVLLPVLLRVLLQVLLQATGAAAVRGGDAADAPACNQKLPTSSAAAAAASFRRGIRKKQRQKSQKKDKGKTKEKGKQQGHQPFAAVAGQRASRGLCSLCMCRLCTALLA